MKRQRWRQDMEPKRNAHNYVNKNKKHGRSIVYSGSVDALCSADRGVRDKWYNDISFLSST